MTIKKKLEKDQTILISVQPTKYQSTINSLVKELHKETLCYISLNKTYESIKEVFDKQHVQDHVIVDDISKTIKKVEGQKKDCYYINSPAALTELSLVINKLLEYEIDYLIFDAVSSMLVYRTAHEVENFLQTITSKIKGTKTKAVFLIIKNKQSEEVLEQASTYFDEVISKK